MILLFQEILVENVIYKVCNLDFRRWKETYWKLWLPLNIRHIIWTWYSESERFEALCERCSTTEWKSPERKINAHRVSRNISASCPAVKFAPDRKFRRYRRIMRWGSDSPPAICHIEGRVTKRYHALKTWAELNILWISFKFYMRELLAQTHTHKIYSIK